MKSALQIDFTSFIIWVLFWNSLHIPIIWNVFLKTFQNFRSYITIWSFLIDFMQDEDMNPVSFFCKGHLLVKLYLLQNIFALFVNTHIAIAEWIYFWALCSVLFCSVHLHVSSYVCGVLVVLLGLYSATEIRSRDASQLFLRLRIALAFGLLSS